MGALDSRGSLRETLVSDFLSNAAELHPDKTAILCDGNQRLDYAALDARANQVAHALSDAGVETGDRVAILLENCIEAMVSLWGVLKAGAAFVMIHPTTKADKLAYILSDGGVRVLVLPAGRSDALSAACAPGSPVRLVVTCDRGPIPADAAPGSSGSRTAIRSFESVLQASPATPVPRRAIELDLAAIIYTSGSTGRPKGVALTHRNILAAAGSICEYLELSPLDVILNVLPLSFDYGLYQGLMAARMGATLVLEKGFAFPWRVVERVQQERVTVFPGVPTVFAMLLAMRGLDPARLDSVVRVTNTGAALPVAHIPRLRALFRNARLYSMYGLTECKRVTFLPPEELDRRPGSVGRGMPNEEVWLEDADGRRVPPGGCGELVVRGPNVMQGYWGRPEETARVLRPGRYFWERVLYTGDLFRSDEDGFLYFVSRQDDIIKTRGEKVSPREVEEAILELPEVREAAVVGVPDEVLGQAIRAYVVPVEGATIDEKTVRRHCIARLESYMVPSSIEIRDTLPRTETGKTSRSALAIGRDHGSAKPRVCARCVLPESFPGVHLDHEGVCGACRRGAARAEPDAQADEVRARFASLAMAVRERPGFHCLLAYSGGKDSTYTLKLLREEYGLNVLAVTFDNGFMSPRAFENIRLAIEATGAAHWLVRPPSTLMVHLFRSVLQNSPYPKKALERASSVCNACIAFVKNVTLRIAVEQKIPILAYGWSPGQAPTSAALIRMGPSMLRQMHEVRTAPLRAIASEALDPYVLDERHFEALAEPIWHSNPLAFHPYREQEVQQAVAQVGWQRPQDTDGNSSNCLLNGLACRHHIATLGFHPYALEVAGLVRSGAITREEGLRSLSNLGPDEVAVEVARRLGVPMP